MYIDKHTITPSHYKNPQSINRLPLTRRHPIHHPWTTIHIPARWWRYMCLLLHEHRIWGWSLWPPHWGRCRLPFNFDGFIFTQFLAVEPWRLRCISEGITWLKINQCKGECPNKVELTKLKSNISRTQSHLNEIVNTIVFLSKIPEMAIL
jgi:hypothetical protein